MKDSLTLGIYTAEIRDHYIAYKMGKYQIDHPGVPYKRVKKYARVAWARKVNKKPNKKPTKDISKVGA